VRAMRFTVATAENELDLLREVAELRDATRRQTERIGIVRQSIRELKAALDNARPPQESLEATSPERPGSVQKWKHERRRDRIDR
jgi:hypothetical protein